MLTLRSAFRKRLRKAASRPGPGGPGYGPSRHPQSGKGMGVSGAGGVAKPGWATTKQPIPGGGSKISSHKDKRGSTAHHGRGGGGRRQLSVPETHQLRIARDTMRMPDPMVGVMGGPNKEQSKKIIQELTGRPYKDIPADNPYAGGHRNVVAATMKAAVTKAVRLVAKHGEHDQSTHGPGKAEGREDIQRYWQKLGRIAQQTLRPPEARAAYQTAAKLLQRGEQGAAEIANRFAEAKHPYAKEVWQRAYKLATRGK